MAPPPGKDPLPWPADRRAPPAAASRARYGLGMTNIDFTVEMREVYALAKAMGVSSRLTRRAIRYAIADIASQHRAAVRDQIQRDFHWSAGGNAKTFILNRVQIDRTVRGSVDNPAARVHVNLNASGKERSDVAVPVLQDGGTLPPGASRQGTRRTTVTIPMTPQGQNGLRPFTPFERSARGRALVSSKDPSVVLVKMRSGQSALIRNVRHGQRSAERAMRTIAFRDRNARARELTAAFRPLLAPDERVSAGGRSRSRNGRARDSTMLALLVKDASASKHLQFYEKAEEVAEQIVPRVAEKIAAILSMRQRAGER